MNIIETGAINYPFIENFDITHRGKTRNIQFIHPHKTKEECISTNYKDWLNTFLSRVNQFIPPNSTTIDFGASNGDTTIPLGLCSSKVIAFEPGPNFEQLSINCLLNQLNVQCENFAATDKNGLDLFNYDNWNGGHRHKTSYIGHFPDKRLVKTINIKEYIKYLNIDNLSFIKTDTEDYDVILLNLIIDEIKKFRPVIHIEWFPDTTKDLSKFIISNNYFCIDFYKWEFWSVLPKDWTMDLLLVPKEFNK